VSKGDSLNLLGHCPQCGGPLGEPGPCPTPGCLPNPEPAVPETEIERLTRQLAGAVEDRDALLALVVKAEDTGRQTTEWGDAARALIARLSGGQ